MASDADLGGEAPCLMPLLDDQGQIPDTSGVRLCLKRVYEPPAPSDGHRVMIDRLWPRGLKRDAAHIDAWLREIAPSDALRRWFGHDPARWDEFHARYRAELAQPERRAALAALLAQARRGTVTLLYAARDEAHNNAVVLRDALISMARDA